jgi:serine phosphatase RsbU (regulator of sigma subunit)
MLRPPSLVSQPSQLPLPEREALLVLCEESRINGKLILAGVDINKHAFFDDLKDQLLPRLLVDNTLHEDTLTNLKRVNLEPKQCAVSDFPQFQSPEDSRTCWVLPYNSLDKSKRWLVILSDGDSPVVQEIENLFLKLELMLARCDLEAAQSQLEEANAWIDQELEEMTRLQQLMLPSKNQSIPGAEIAFTYRAMRGAGGDYIDFLSKCENPEKSELHKLGMIVADVTGHGPSAAMEVAMMDAIIRTYRPEESLESPSRILNYINKHFFTRKERSSFITAVACHYCPISKRLLYANAGHPNAYIKRGQEIISLDGGGIPIGVMRDYEWNMYEQPVKSGDTLFVYTDVVIETKSPDNQDFGFERLEFALKQSDNAPEALIKNMERTLKEFCHCKTFQDDMTMCAVQFL